MNVSISIWMDFAGSAAIIFLLTVAYGHVRRSFLSVEHGHLVLGFAFGCVAWMQMNIPLEPMPGLIVDLRNVPLVLCAAFLGWRATLICFALAALTRVGIGGIGMWSALVAMTIATGVGAMWARATSSIPDRGISHMVLLSVLASLHLLGAFVLGEPARSWFFANAVLPIAVLNLITISVAAYLLDSEQKRIGKEHRLAASAVYDPDHVALTKPAFERELMLRVSAGSMLPPAGLLIVRLRYWDTLFSIVPRSWRDKILGLVRMRLKDAFANADLVGSLGSNALVIPLSAQDFLERDTIQARITRLMNAEAFEFSSDMSKLISVDTQICAWPAGYSLERALRSARFGKSSARQSEASKGFNAKGQNRRALSKDKTGREKQMGSNQLTMEYLFGKAAFLMKSGQTR